jgi:FlaA1/EpsC-like NDP-sugar epimerase
VDASRSNDRLSQQVRRAFDELLQLKRSRKRALVFALDAFLCLISVFIAFSLRVGALQYPLEPPLIFAAVALPLFVPVFYLAQVYSTIFRFAGSRTIMQLAKAIAVYSVPLIAIFLLWGVKDVPRTIAILQPMIFFGFAATSRIVAQHVLMGMLARRGAVSRVKPVLIYGAGSSGRQLLMSLRHDPCIIPVGFIDDDARLDQQRLDGVRIHHSSRLGKIIQKQEIGAVLLALPRISRKRRVEIVEQLRAFHVHVQTLPNISEIVDGRVSINDLREVQIEDLLGRDSVTPNSLLLARTIVGKTVLVTGAGGSIGSELCRQILANGARRLVLYEISEFSLYEIDRELRQLRAEQGLGHVEIVPVLGSVIDRERLTFIFQRWRPETVYHAAAYKHVPLVEANPAEGIRNNIIGTEEVVRAAEASGVSDFILISTDKAVRPTNIMGATKRAAEQVVQAYAAKNGPTRYSMVRFGNVLGSSGSVVPLFRRQIENGGPVTLTHKDVTRYFMTIPEAAQLVLQAGGLARGGEVFVLDMGNAVRIADLAKAMIELSGLTVRDEAHPDGDIEIAEIGLRPGEKLYEELLIGNAPQPTKHERILMAHETFMPLDQLEVLLSGLRLARGSQELIEILKRLVPEFEHRRDNAAVIG